MNTRMNKRSQIGSFAIEAAFVILAMVTVGFAFWVTAPVGLIGFQGSCVATASGSPLPTPAPTGMFSVSNPTGHGFLGILNLALCYTTGNLVDSTMNMQLQYNVPPYPVP